MFEKISIETYFDIIKKNHLSYLETNVVTHLDLAGVAHKKAMIEQYLTYIKDNHQLQQDYLEDSIQGLSMTERMGGGLTSILIGLGIGALLFTQEQSLPSMDVFGAKAVAQGGFSAMIGASCGALIYKAWSNSQEKPLHSDYETCINEMKKAGFSEKKYQELSQKLVQLFHFRECLLLGLKDHSQVNMRTAFKNRYFPGGHIQKFNDDDFNLSIEVYFLNQLDELFHQAFQDIYQIHQQDIVDEQESSGFIRWIKKHFESEENQQRFTQQMQVEFMNQCMHFLEKEMSEPSFLAKYVYGFDTLAGLIASAIAVGVLAAFIPIIPVAGLIGIGIVSASIAAVSTHLMITENDTFYYQRTSNNRQSIHTAIQQIASEQKRLTQLIRKVVKTTHKDLADLKKYDEQGDSCFLNILLVENQYHIFTGSVHSWVREFANRFNDSKFITIDLSARLKSLITDANVQTNDLQMLMIHLQSQKSQDLKALTKYIEDTKTYLAHPDNQAFITTFESRQKIKEQCLEIISFISLESKEMKPPKILVDFYTMPVAKGGLGGLEHDLYIARRLAPIVSPTISADTQHPYHSLLNIAFNVNLKLNAQQSNFILQGDRHYRKMLKFPPDHIPHIEDYIHIGTIKDYLDASFNFLCSLNEYDTAREWNQAFQNHDEFILYRMLLVKQLASLADPNNIRVEALVKQEINNFVRTKLNCDPDIALDDILHQAWLLCVSQDTRLITDQLGNTHAIGTLASVADAIRVDLTYVSNPLTPKQLITQEAQIFLSQSTHPYLFGLTSEQLIPEYSSYFYQNIKDTIASTLTFIDTLKATPLMQQTFALRIYVCQILKDIERLMLQIEHLLSLPENPRYMLDKQPMCEIKERLIQFKEELPVFENQSLAPSENTPFSSTTDRSKLTQILAELDKMILKESAPKMGNFFHHKKNHQEKIAAITRLKNALEQQNRNGTPETYDWYNDAIYQTDKRLKNIINEFFPETPSLMLALNTAHT